MDWIQQAIRDFGASIGVDDLVLDETQGVELTLDSGELIGISHLPDTATREMLVYATAPLHFSPLRQLEKALRLANARQGVSWLVQTAISNGQLMLAMRLPARSFDLPALDEAVSHLMAMQQEAADAG